MLEKSGQAICPYDPRHNSTFIYVGELLSNEFVILYLRSINCVVYGIDRVPNTSRLFLIRKFDLDNELYAGTVADFAGTDPIIYREPLQTEQYDSMSLNGE